MTIIVKLLKLLLASINGNTRGRHSMDTGI